MRDVGKLEASKRLLNATMAPSANTYVILYRPETYINFPDVWAAGIDRKIKYEFE